MSLPEEKRQRIIGAIEQAPYDWRTARGIARETDLDSAEVAAFLDSSRDMVRSHLPNRHGEALYTTRNRFKRGTPLRKRWFCTLINRVD